MLKGDKNEIFRAAANAQKICDYATKLAVDSQPFAAREPAEQGDSEPVLERTSTSSKLLVNSLRNELSETIQTLIEHSPGSAIKAHFASPHR